VSETLLKPDGVTIVAELSCSHGGLFTNALMLIEHAKAAGADAVKFQLFTPDDMVGVGREGPMLTAGPWAGKTLRQLYKETMTPRSWFPSLFAHARSLGLVPFSSVLSLEGVDYLETLGCCAYKIPSAEIGWLELIGKAGDTGKPVLVSTGMADVNEIREAVFADATLLYCVAAYPCPLQYANLSQLFPDDEHDWPYWGVSDHSKSLIPPIVATAFGARLIEKHIRLPNVETPDSGFALTPGEVAAMVQAVRDTEAAMREPTEDVEQESRQWKRRVIDGQWLRG
jgi:sialic acid synthase SpsE